MAIDYMSPSRLEAALSVALRGRRLAFEIGLDETRLEAALRTFCPLGSFDVRSLHLYPATLIVLLASAGNLRYRGGDFWSSLGLSGPVTSTVGRRFLDALERLGLETFEAVFEQERALRYLTPILAHGGIPQYCLGDFFRLLVRTIGLGNIDAQEILSLWRSRHSLTQAVDRPAIRFLLHGGEPALDFLERCVDLVLETSRRDRVPDALELGLPQSLVEAFEAFRVGSAPLPKDGLPRPSIRLDPWDGLGPTLELPPSEAAADFEWRFRDDRHTLVLPGSRLLGRSIRLAPARTWEVEFRRRDGDGRSFVFECFDKAPVLFFDPASGRLWRNKDQLRLLEVFVLHSKAHSLWSVDREGAARPLSPIEELPQPAGVWAECRLGRYNLEGATYLWVKRGVFDVARFPVATPGARPQLIGGGEVPLARTIGGAILYAEVPAIKLPEVPDVPWERWRVSARSHGESRTTTAASLRRSGPDFSLREFLGDWLVRDIDLTVRGPLGSDLSASVAVVPGLKIQRPDHVLLPHEASQLLLSADSAVHFGPRDLEGRIALRIEDGADHARCEASIVAVRLGLRLEVPRLTWALARGQDAGVTQGSDLLIVDAGDLLESNGALLVVGTGLPGVRVRLTLNAGSAVLQTSDWATTAQSGRLFFELARFRDSVLRGGGPNPEFQLSVEGHTVRVVRVVTRLDAHDIQASLVEGADSSRLECRFVDPRSLRGREFRLWSQHRPWADPVILPVADGELAFECIEGSAVPPPGHYLAEVALSDHWNRPVRPRPGAQNTTSVTLGSPESIERYRQSLDTTDPLNVLEAALASSKLARPLTVEEVSDVLPQALEAACWLLACQGARALNSRAFHYLTAVFAGDASTLARAAGAALDSGRASPSDLLSLAIATVPLLRSPEGPVDGEHRAAAPISSPPPADSLVRDLWTACPPIAALLDAPAAHAGDEAAIERCERALGIRPGQPVEAGGAVTQVEWLLPLEHLTALRRAMQLNPVRLLDSDALVEATFEWLLAQREGRIDSAAWCRQHDGVQRELPVLDAEIQRHLASRKTTPTFDEGMKLSRRVLGASLHIAGAGPHTGKAVEALLPLVDRLPRLVTRDVTLAIMLVHAAQRSTRDIAQ